MPFRSEARLAAHRTRQRVLKRKVNVTLLLSDYLAFYRVAQDDDRSIAQTVAELAKAQLAAKPFLTEHERVLLNNNARQLRAIGNNLNQIAHACNLRARQGHIPEAKQCLEYLTKLYNLSLIHI